MDLGSDQCTLRRSVGLAKHTLQFGTLSTLSVDSVLKTVEEAVTGETTPVSFTTATLTTSVLYERRGDVSLEYLIC